jgi:hypothetical protein
MAGMGSYGVAWLLGLSTSRSDYLNEVLGDCPCYGERSQECLKEVCLVGLYLLSWISCP